MSKKTLHSQFAGKEAIVAAVIDVVGQTIRRQTGVVLEGPSLGFDERLGGVSVIVGAHFGRTSPVFLRERERSALLRIGVAEGVIRGDLDLDLAVEFWLQAINGLTQPKNLERLGLTPREVFEKGLHLFLQGIFTEAGRKAFARRPRT